MKFGKILLQEAIRSIALGWIVFMASSLLYRGGVLSLQMTWQLPLALMILVFVGFTLTRRLTGRDLMIRSEKGWLILAAVTNATLLIFVVVAVSLSQTEVLLEHGVWPYVAAVVLTGLLTWGNYRASARHRNNNQDS